MKKYLCLLICVFMVAGLFTACTNEEAATTETTEASSTEETVEEATEATTSETELTGEFKIGIILPLTGSYAEHGVGQQTAYEMAIEEVNASGGVNGKTLVAQFEDSGGDAVVSSELMRKYIEDPDIMMVFGDYDSGTCLADAPIAQENQMPMLSPSASNANVPLTGNYIFTMVGVQQDEQRYVAQYAMQKYFGAENIGIVYLDNSWGTTLFENLSLGAEACGLNMVITEPIAAGETDFSAVISKLRQSDIDTLFIGLQISEGAAMVNQMVQTGYNEEVNVVLSGALYTNQFIELTGENCEGLIITQPFFVSEDNEELYAWQEEYYSRCDLYPSMMTADAYDAIMMCAEAINAAGAETRDEVRDAVSQISGYQGITGEITFDGIGTVHRTQYLITIEDGKWKMLYDPSYASDMEFYDFGIVQ